MFLHIRGKMMAGMQLEIYQNNGEVLMHLRGNLDGSGACQVEHALKRLQDKANNCRLIFDLRGIRSFEYFGIAILAKRIRGQKGIFKR
jgi:anti-anti-sigma factor